MADDTEKKEGVFLDLNGLEYLTPKLLAFSNKGSDIDSGVMAIETISESNLSSVTLKSNTLYHIEELPSDITIVSVPDSLTEGSFMPSYLSFGVSPDGVSRTLTVTDEGATLIGEPDTGGRAGIIYSVNKVVTMNMGDTYVPVFVETEDDSFIFEAGNEQVTVKSFTLESGKEELVLNTPLDGTSFIRSLDPFVYTVSYYQDSETLVKEHTVNVSKYDYYMGGYIGWVWVNEDGETAYHPYQTSNGYIKIKLTSEMEGGGG